MALPRRFTTRQIIVPRSRIIEFIRSIPSSPTTSWRSRIGITGGLLLFTFGGAASPYTDLRVKCADTRPGRNDRDVAAFAFLDCFSEAVRSPAAEPGAPSARSFRRSAHHNSNYGSTLAIFDWLFGTLTIPPRRRPKLSFGVEGIAEPHRAETMLLRPFTEAAGVLKRSSERKPAIVADAEMAQVT